MDIFLPSIECSYFRNIFFHGIFISISSINEIFIFFILEINSYPSASFLVVSIPIIYKYNLLISYSIYCIFIYTSDVISNIQSNIIQSKNKQLFQRQMDITEFHLQDNALMGKTRPKRHNSQWFVGKWCHDDCNNLQLVMLFSRQNYL